MAIHNYDGMKFESFKELMAYWDSQRTLWDDIRSYGWYLPKRKVGEAYRAVKWAWQRVFRGWDDRESWNIDHYLCKRLGEQLVAMSGFAHGYPGEEYPFERWTADLKTHGEALVAYAADDDVRDSAIEPAQDALRWVADHLPKIWD